MNKTISRYINKNILYPKLIHENPSINLGIIIVIPCYNEPDVSASVLSIANCVKPECSVEIIVSINAGIHDADVVKNRNINSRNELLDLQRELPEWLKVFPIINNELPSKKAGVGLGRKIGMDEAVLRFVELERARGIIVCFDADSGCEPSYLLEIHSHFLDPMIESVSIHYEHPISGNEFTSDIYDSIVQYELHLRYFIRMQKIINLPYAYQTVGSSMACTVSSYCAVGGMNQRKAGEDFYFIHKLVKFGKHSELNTTTVIPSPRISDRVPFGTGRAIGEMQALNDTRYFTYAPASFYDLKILVDNLPFIYESKEIVKQMPVRLNDFLLSINVNENLQRILKNTTDYDSFHKMFWHWFDAFILMKYLHYARDFEHPDIPVLEAIDDSSNQEFESARNALMYYRELDIK